MAEPILSLCCMRTTCLVKIFSVYVHVHFMLESSFLHLAQLHSYSWTFQYERLYCHLSKKPSAGCSMREQMSPIVRRQTSLLVFIFIIYISLNVQCVKCSTVKYLYMHNLSWLIYLSHRFSRLHRASIIERSYYVFILIQLITFACVYYFNSEFSLLNMSYCCLYLCTHIYI